MTSPYKIASTLMTSKTALMTTAFMAGTITSIWVKKYYDKNGCCCKKCDCDPCQCGPCNNTKCGCEDCECDPCVCQENGVTTKSTGVNITKIVKNPITTMVTGITGGIAICTGAYYIEPYLPNKIKPLLIGGSLLGLVVYLSK